MLNRILLFFCKWGEWFYDKSETVRLAIAGSYVILCLLFLLTTPIIALCGVVFLVFFLVMMNIAVETIHSQNPMKTLKIIPIKDDNSDFNLVYLDKSPHCKTHGAMNKVSVHEDGGGYWRCLQGSCRAGCNELKK